MPGPAAPAQTPPAAQPPQAAAPTTADDPLGQLIGTVNRTRDAVGAIRKVPDSFEKALAEKGK